MINKQFTIFRCSICQQQLNSYKRGKAMNILTQQASGNFKSEIACRKCIKQNFLQCKTCGKILFDLRPLLQGEILTCVECRITKPQHRIKEIGFDQNGLIVVPTKQTEIGGKPNRGFTREEIAKEMATIVKKHRKTKKKLSPSEDGCYND